jgi:5-guanidino-2-oxopentanoate decarboxylase
MTMRAETSIGEALVFLLQDYGVDTIFGIPGVHNVEMYRALPRSKIRHILPRHEQGAGFMADGYARATGRPGVCFTITGPGLTNILTPLGQAWSDSSNVLVISSALDVVDSAQGRGRLHEMINQLQVAASVTSHASRAYSAKDVQDGLSLAFSRFASTRLRPAYLEIPLDVLAMPSGKGWKTHSLPERPIARPADIDRAIAKLQRAQNPYIILGGGAQEAGEGALSIAQKLGAPIITTTAGKGAVRADHPLCWGYLLGEAAVQARLRQSDCILAVGTELAETDFWTTDIVLPELVRIDIDPASLARPHGAAIAILGDASDALLRIDAGLKTRKSQSSHSPPHTEQTDLRKQLGSVLAVIRDSLPDETIVASDMTQIAYAANQLFPVLAKRCWLHPTGFGTLGFALPAAIGAKFGVGTQPVAALVGDYGLQYTVNELATAVEHHLPIPILLWNNNGLGEIRDDMVQKAIQPNAVTLRNPDFQMLAKSFGAQAVKPSNLSDLGRAVTSALKADGPTLIEMTPALTA